MFWGEGVWVEVLEGIRGINGNRKNTIKNKLLKKWNTFNTFWDGRGGRRDRMGSPCCTPSISMLRDSQNPTGRTTELETIKIHQMGMWLSFIMTSTATNNMCLAA